MINTKNQETIDELDALTDVEDHLQFAANIIQGEEISTALKSEIHSQINQIQKRRGDPNLYLAVIGEFSSGKSTFINALLRDDLLKTSVLPTTAAATKLRYGSCLEVQVQLGGTRSGTIKTHVNSQKITIPWLPGVNGINNREYIHVLTAKDEVAKDVKQLTITHPAPFLANSIVIIDTPGTNATNTLHGEITRKVIANEADAVIIIIPATMPLSQSLASFLGGALRPFLHRCVFVVTRMDQIKQPEHSDVLNNLRSRLIERLGIKPPILYSCSAQVVIDDITGEEPVPPDLLMWKHRFEQLEKLVVDRLCRERLLAISENVLRLLTRLFEQLEGNLRSQWENYQHRQEAIKREIIPDLALFTAEQQLWCQRMLDDAISTTIAKSGQCVEKYRDKTISKIYNAIFNAKDLQALENVVKNEAESILKIAQDELQQELQNKIKSISQAAIAASREFDSKFVEVYSRLQTLGGGFEIQNTMHDGVQINTSDVFTSMQSLQEQMDTKDGFVTVGGIATGSVIGTAILPVVGTVIGGLVGLIVSGRIVGASLEKRKQQLWDKLRPSLDSHFNSVKSKTEDEIQTYARSISNFLKQHINQYMAQYKATVEGILQVQKTELQRLTNLQTTMQADLQEINRRWKSLSAKQQKLAAIEGK
ncbi:MAG: dynamin family protein [Stigonema ocellatum SAG 48.90 = DSM 106950]|nr:dynamin family protein [Stigonema ocellatum SAG 48.90 = DSM 106950]